MTQFLPQVPAYAPNANAPYSIRQLSAQCGKQSYCLKTDWVYFLQQLRRFAAADIVLYHGNSSHCHRLRLYKMSVAANSVYLQDTQGRLSIDLSYWHCGFLYIADKRNCDSHFSFHIFDIYGVLLCSIMPEQPLSQIERYFFKKICTQCVQYEYFMLSPQCQLCHQCRIGQADTVSLLSHWRHLNSEHAIPVILAKHGLTRLEAVQLLAPHFSQVIKVSAFFELMQHIEQQSWNISLSLHSSNMLQSYQGGICASYQAVYHWYCYGQNFYLQLEQAALASAWIVHKPSSEGLLSSLELYHHSGELLLSLTDLPTGDVVQRGEWFKYLQLLTRVAA